MSSRSLLTALLFAVGACAPAFKAPRLVVTPASTGVLQLSSGHGQVRVDLREDVPGCLGELYDPTTGERLGAGASLRVLDLSDRGGHSYILLTAVAPPNCNIQGRCGAAPQPNVNLIWLKMTPDLTIEKKQTVAVEDCRLGRYVGGVPDNWAEHLRLTDGRLRIAFTELGQGAEDVTRTAEYDRQSPEAGIRVGRSQ